MYNRMLVAALLAALLAAVAVAGSLSSVAASSEKSKQTVIARRTWTYLLPAETPITHPELTNREMWIDFFSQNPITKVYHLYKQFDSIGIHPDDLDVVQLPYVLDDEHY